jgi:integrase
LPKAVPKPAQTFVPYIYSRDQLRRLLNAIADNDNPRCRIDPGSYRTLLLLLYGAGLRIGEALALTWGDVDLASGILCIRETKFYKTRLVPISQDLTRILRSHPDQRRGEHSAPDTPFLLSRIGKAITIQNAEMAFCRLRVRADVICENADTRHQPRLHDLRHSFAVHRLVSWYQSGADVQRLLPKLATYLGHVHISGTQRYLTLTPELLREASVRFERYAMEKTHG